MSIQGGGGLSVACEEDLCVSPALTGRDRQKQQQPISRTKKKKRAPFVAPSHVCFSSGHCVTPSLTLVLFLVQGGIGLNVAQMIVELIRDKRKIVDRITHAQIDEFVSLLEKSQVRNFC